MKLLGFSFVPAHNMDLVDDFTNVAFKLKVFMNGFLGYNLKNAFNSYEQLTLIDYFEIKIDPFYRDGMTIMVTLDAANSIYLNSSNPNRFIRFVGIVFNSIR